MSPPKSRAAPYATLHTPADLLTQFTHTITLHQHYATIHVTQMHSGESWCVWDESWHVGRVMYDDESDQTKTSKRIREVPAGYYQGSGCVGYPRAPRALAAGARAC